MSAWLIVAATGALLTVLGMVWMWITRDQIPEDYLDSEYRQGPE